MKQIIMDIETTGLEPIKNDDRILAIGVVKDEYMHILIDMDEAAMLYGFWDMVDEYDQLVGFNIQEFDIRFIILRSIKHSIPIKKFLIMDLRKVLACGTWHRAANGTLDDFCSVFGIENEDKSNGLEMAVFGHEWLSGDEDAQRAKAKIVDHLRWCLRKTKRLKERIEEVGLIK